MKLKVYSIGEDGEREVQFYEDVLCIHFGSDSVFLMFAKSPDVAIPLSAFPMIFPD